MEVSITDEAIEGLYRAIVAERLPISRVRTFGDLVTKRLADLATIHETREARRRRFDDLWSMSIDGPRGEDWTLLWRYVNEGALCVFYVGPFP